MGIGEILIGVRNRALRGDAGEEEFVRCWWRLCVTTSREHRCTNRPREASAGSYAFSRGEQRRGTMGFVTGASAGDAVGWRERHPR